MASVGENHGELLHHGRSPVAGWCSVQGARNRALTHAATPGLCAAVRECGPRLPDGRDARDGVRRRGAVARNLRWRTVAPSIGMMVRPPGACGSTSTGYSVPSTCLTTTNRLSVTVTIP